MKRLILCCDGTWNSADQESDKEPCPSNVVKFCFRIAKRDKDISQIIFYDQGVGTGNSFDRLTGGAFGGGLEDNIHDAYRFLIANYESGDELYLLGFSRGAFTARSIAGMIRKCGILSRINVSKYRDALALYHREMDPNHPDAVKFRAQYSINGDADTRIRFIGVWDTVGALGMPLRGFRWLNRDRYQFHDTRLSKTVDFAYQALSIDEHRAPFEPSIWTYEPKPDQQVEQVWFCGVHSDVGGGYPSEQCGQSDIPLQWMLEKVKGAGLVLDEDVMCAHVLHPDPLAKLHNSKVFLYRLTPGIDRVIGQVIQATRSARLVKKQVDPTQSLHPSVQVRWDADPSYRPISLVNYFKMVEGK